MKCAWKELLSILPMWMRQEVDKYGRENGQELRLRIDLPPQLITAQGELWLQKSVSAEDLSFCVNAASRYSPWAAASSSNGYITAPGGHRIGLCGDVVLLQGKTAGIKNLSSLCIRIARDIPGVAARTADLMGSVLILGSPGAGKTTFLRDMIRQRSEKRNGSVAVVDERGELFPRGFSSGRRTDVLTGCSKVQGIEMALRTMGPACIAVDEITSPMDCEALLGAGWCGVTLLATAHASSLRDLYKRPVYQSLAKSDLFDNIIVMNSDKSWKLERTELWASKG